MALAKLTRPASIGSVLRKRLFRRLDQAGKRPVTWVWAPPGAGKTTLVSSYLAAKRLRALWYQVDSGDNDLATFFYYLGLAAPKRKRAMALFTPEYRQGLAIFTRNFFRELFSRLKPPFAVVFDNYQEIDSDSPLHEALQGALAEIPPGGRVIFISRTDAPAPFAALRAKQAIEVLEWSEVRFTRNEVKELVKRTALGRWRGPAIDRLLEIVNGWAAGLVLLLEQHRRKGETAVETAKEPFDVVFDYFAGEIFNNLNLETKDILLQTAFLPQVTATMAVELTGVSVAGKVLADLYKQNYFTNRQTGSDPVYEYHPLFREFLLSQASRTYDAARKSAIRRAAARLVEGCGRIEAAAVLLRDAEDWDRLTDFISRYAPTLLRQGRAQTVEESIDAIPETTLVEHPWLTYWRAMCRLPFSPEESLPWFEKAFHGFKSRKDRAGELLAWSGAVDAIILDWGSLNELDPWLEEFDSLSEDSLECPSPDIEARVSASRFIALMWRQPYHPEIDAWGKRAIESSEATADFALRMLARSSVIYHTLRMGYFREAGVLIASLKGLFKSPETPPVILIQAKSIEALYRWNIGEVTEALRLADEGFKIAETTGVHVWDHHLLSQRIQALLSAGQLSAAQEALAQLGQNNGSKATRLAHYHYLAAWESVLRKDLASAQHHQQAALNWILPSGSVFPIGHCHYATAQVLSEIADGKGAGSHLAQAERIARKIKSLYLEYLCLITRAQLSLDAADERSCLEQLGKAFGNARRGGFFNHVWWRSPVMARLCAKALEAGIEVEYVRMLIRKRNLVPEEVPVHIENWPWPIRIYTLGEFRVLKDDQPIGFSHKVQRKPLALLKAIIALGGKNVSEDTLLDSLWPDAEGDAARFALTSAIHRLRKLLGYDQAIIRQGNVVSLDNRYCWVDLWAVERLVERCEDLLKGNGVQEQWRQKTELLERALKLYQGPFLKGDADVRTSARVVRMRRRLIRLTTRLGERWESEEDFGEAARLYEEGFAIDPCAEDLCRRLMAVYHRLGRPAEAARIYKQFEQAIFQETGARPSLETESLARRSVHL